MKDLVGFYRLIIHFYDISMAEVFQLQVTRYSNLYLISVFPVNNLYQLPSPNKHLFVVRTMNDLPTPLYLN